jgi:peptidoglycan/LPS O-acetylase OafA/YrhL
MLFISNFVLDLNNITMKRSLLVFLVAGLILLTTLLWMVNSAGVADRTDTIQFGVIGLLISFAVFVGSKRLKSERRGEPAEDELSKRILQKTAAWSYYISLYLWVAMIYIRDRVSMDTEQLIGTGILGMAVTFAVCWLVFNFRGLRHE